MASDKKIILFRSEKDEIQLHESAEKLIKSERRFLYYRILCAVISLIFLAFAVYSLSFLISSGAAFQAGMLIYILVPLIGAVLPFGFVKLKRRDLIAEICEEQGTVILITDDRITVEGSKKRKFIRRNDGKSVFESRATLFSDGDGNALPFRYDIRMSELRYFAYDTERSLFRFILGTDEYPDIVLPENQAFHELTAELETRGIKKTAFIK